MSLASLSFVVSVYMFVRISYLEDSCKSQPKWYGPKIISMNADRKRFCVHLVRNSLNTYRRRTRFDKAAENMIGNVR
jgi:hypothetical protein